MSRIDEAEFYFYNVYNGMASDAIRSLVLQVKDHSIRELLIRALGDILRESSVKYTIELLYSTYDKLKEMENQTWINKSDLDLALTKFDELLKKG